MSEVFIGFRCFRNDRFVYTAGGEPLIFPQLYYQKFDNVRTLTKDGYLVDPNGELKPLPEFIQFQNTTQSFEVATMQHDQTHVGRFRLALRIGYFDLEDT